MTANQIIPGLYVGDAHDAIEWQGPRLFVGEDSAEDYGYYTMREDDEHVPILRRDHAGAVVPHVDHEGRFAQPKIPLMFPPIADKTQLDHAVNIIRAKAREEAPLLVHCHAGIERSPLTVSYYLWRSGHATSFAAAFKLVAKARTQAAWRGAWLPRELQPPTHE